MLKTVDDACDFIAEWCGTIDGRAGKPLKGIFALPNCIVRLNTRVGSLWYDAKPLTGPALRFATPFAGVLAGQDQILNPDTYVRDESGIIPFIIENQGVWRYGFDPADMDQLFVSGDWCDGLGEDFEAEWRPVEAKPEDALICTLLSNLCLQSNFDWVESMDRPEGSKMLWQHPAWTDFDGFWLNEERTLIYYGSWRVARK